MNEREMNLKHASEKLVKEVFKLQRGEKCLICIDSKTDALVHKEIESAVRVEKACVETIDLAGLSKEKATAVLMDRLLDNFDAVCELSGLYFYDTRLWPYIREKGLKLYRVGELCVNSFINCIGKVDIAALSEFGAGLFDILNNCKEIRISTKKGTELSFKLTNNLLLKIFSKLMQKPVPKIWMPTGGPLSKADATFMGGQVSIQGFHHTINGKAVVDGYITGIGPLNEDVILDIKNGVVKNISGGKKAEKVKAVMNNSNTDIQHFCIGFNPGASLTESLLEAERIFGYITIGFAKHALHTDGIIKNPTIYTDGKLLLENMSFKHSDLVGLQEKLLKGS